MPIQRRPSEAFDAMVGMRKINIAAIEAARHG